MARARGQRFVSRASRPNRDWSHTADEAYVVLAANTVVLRSVFIPSNPGIDVTVLRTVGFISVVSDQTGASEEQMGAFGMIIVTDSAVAIGVSAMPDPTTEGGDDWFVYQAFSQQSALNTIGVGSVNYPFDSRAKRIVQGSGINVALMVANSHATQGLSFAVTLRMLAQVRGTR